MKWIQERQEEQRQRDIQRRIVESLRTQSQRRQGMGEEELQCDREVEIQMKQFLRDRNIRRQELNRLLEQSVNTGNMEKAEYLIACGADPNGCVDDFESPIFMKVIMKDEKMIELFLREGAEPSRKNQYGVDSLQLSIRCHRNHVFFHLLNVCRQEDLDLDSFIIICICDNNPEILKFLLSEYPYLRVSDLLFNLAQERNYRDILHVLVQCGISPKMDLFQNSRMRIRNPILRPSCLLSRCQRICQYDLIACDNPQNGPNLLDRSDTHILHEEEYLW